MARRTKAIFVFSVLCAIFVARDVCHAQEDEFTKAQAKTEAGDYQGAVEIYEQIIKKYEGKDNKVFARASFLRGENYRLLGKEHIVKQEKSLRDAVVADPQNPEYRLRLAKFYEEEKRASEAIAQYDYLVWQLNSSDTTAIKNLIDFYENEKSYPKTAALYEKLSKQKPTDAQVYYSLGLALTKSRRASEAETAFKQAVYFNPQHTKAHLELGKIYFERENLGLAQNEYQAILRYDANNSDAVEGMKQLKKAEHINEVLKQASEAIPKTNINLLTELFRELEVLHREDPQKASIENTLKDVRLRLADLWLEEGARYENKEKKTETLQWAIQAYETALTFAHGDPEREMRARDGISRAQAELGVHERVEAVHREAESSLAVAMELSEEERELKERKLQEAKEGFIAVSVLDPRQRRALSPRQKRAEIEILYFWGLVAMSSYNWDQATFYFFQVMELDSTFLDVRTRYIETDRRRKQQQRFNFLRDMAQTAYTDKKWGVAEYALTEIRSLVPKDTNAIVLLERLKKERQSTELRKNLVLLGRFTGVVIILAFIGRFLIPRLMKGMKKSPKLIPMIVTVIIVVIIGAVTLQWNFILSLPPNRMVFVTLLILGVFLLLLLILAAGIIKKTHVRFNVRNNIITLLPEVSDGDNRMLTIIGENNTPIQLDEIEIKHIEGLKLHCEKLEFSPTKVLPGSLEFKPIEDHFALRTQSQTKNHNVILKHLRISPSMEMSFEKAEEDLRLELKNTGGGKGSGTLEILSPFKLITSKCMIESLQIRVPYRILDEKQGVVGQRQYAPTLIEFFNYAGYCEIVFKGLLKNVENCNVPFLELDNQLLFNVSMKDIHSVPMINRDQFEDEVVDGIISFPKSRKQTIVLDRTRPFVKAIPNKFGNMKIAKNADTLNMQFHGVLSSLKIANDPVSLHTAMEELDNYLIWFRKERATISFIIGFTAALFGLLLDIIGVI